MDEHDESRERHRDHPSPPDPATATGASKGSLVVNLAFAGGLVVLGGGVWLARKMWKAGRTR